MAKDDKKIKIPKSVRGLKMSMKKFAKKNDIRIKGKGLSKKDKKRNQKRLIEEYSEFAINGLNKAVKILAEHPDAKKIDKVSKGVDNIISNPDVMKRIAKIYKNNKDEYPNMKYLPYMIMNTLMYYSSDNLSDEEKEIAKDLDPDALISFSEKILKSEVKRYRKSGLDDGMAFTMASTIPTTKLFKNRKWYKTLITTMYDLAEKEELDVDMIFKSILKLDKHSKIKKRQFLEEFFSEFIMTRASNKNAKFTETQKELHAALIERTLIYFNSLKPKDLRVILKEYIKRRKRAEEYSNDGKRVIKFTDHSNSNSPYENIKTCVQDLIADNASNESYLS